MGRRSDTFGCVQFLSRTEPHKRLEVHSLPAMPTYNCTAQVTPSEWYSGIENLVPETVQGSEFLSKFGKHYDKATEVLPGFMYASQLFELPHIAPSGW